MSDRIKEGHIETNNLCPTKWWHWGRKHCLHVHKQVSRTCCERTEPRYEFVWHCCRCEFELKEERE